MRDIGEGQFGKVLLMSAKVSALCNWPRVSVLLFTVNLLFWGSHKRFIYIHLNPKAQATFLWNIEILPGQQTLSTVMPECKNGGISLYREPLGGITFDMFSMKKAGEDLLSIFLL